MANQIQVSAISNTGRVRDNNEDNLYVISQYMKQGEQGNFHLSKTVENNSFICAVCDGMGGEKSGEQASFEAVNRFNYAVSENSFAGITLQEKIQAINKYIGETNAAIYNMAASSFDLKGMGTTFACLLISQGQAAAMNVGDSRVYLFRNGLLKQLTRDHSESERLIRLGIITREQARGHKSRFMLNRHLGMPPEEGILEADTSEIIQLQKGDIFLLCSDGLTDMVEDEDIKKIIEESEDSQKGTQQLINEALKNGGKDNVTVVLVKIQKAGRFALLPSTDKGKRKDSQKKKILLACVVILLAALGAAVAILWGSQSKLASTTGNTNKSTNQELSAETAIATSTTKSAQTETTFAITASPTKATTSVATKETTSTVLTIQTKSTTIQHQQLQ